jgi:SLA1 homology domain 1, SHD1
MTCTPPLFASLILLATAADLAQARTWSDASGNYKVDADLIAFSDKKVILERTDDKQLISLQPDEFSKADQEYLKSKEAADTTNTLSHTMQTWTMRDGSKVIGKVVDFGRKQITIQRQDSKIYVNDRLLDNMPEIYQTMIPKILAFFEHLNSSDRQNLEDWAVRQEGQPRTFDCEGVLFELENGDRYGVPFFLFSEEDQKILKPGWDSWVASNDDYQKHDESAFDLRALAAANKQNSEASDQIARTQLLMQSVTAGMTDIWEVTLYPGQRGGQWLSVVVPGRDSREATMTALQRNPGYTAGPVRRLNRN